MAVGDLSFAVGGNQNPDGARRRKAVADAMIGGAQQMPQDIGQGLSALGNAFYQRQQNRAAQFPAAPPAPAGATPQPFDFGSFMAKHLGINSGGLS